MQDLALLRTVDADVLGRAEIANLPIEGRELWQLDGRPEAFLPDDLVGDGELVIAGLLSEDGRPRVKGSDALLLQGTRTEILEEQI